jgi:hypothetical protein
MLQIDTDIEPELAVPVEWYIVEIEKASKRRYFLFWQINDIIVAAFSSAENVSNENIHKLDNVEQKNLKLETYSQPSSPQQNLQDLQNLRRKREEQYGNVSTGYNSMYKTQLSPSPNNRTRKTTVGKDDGFCGMFCWNNYNQQEIYSPFYWRASQREKRMKKLEYTDWCHEYDLRSEYSDKEYSSTWCYRYTYRNSNNNGTTPVIPPLFNSSFKRGTTNVQNTRMI